jgi:hypothetical protein
MAEISLGNRSTMSMATRIDSTSFDIDESLMLDFAKNSQTSESNAKVYFGRSNRNCSRSRTEGQIFSSPFGWDGLRPNFKQAPVEQKRRSFQCAAAHGMLNAVPVNKVLR